MVRTTSTFRLTTSYQLPPTTCHRRMYTPRTLREEAI